MQYGFYINQKAMIDLRELTGVKLDHGHAAIVNFIKDFAGTGELETKIVNGKTYHWLSYGKISEEMPLYDWEKDTIYRKMKQLVQAKILEHHYDDKQQKAFYAFGCNYIYIVKPIEVPISRGSENNPEGVGLKSEGGTDYNPYNHNTITSSSNKNNNPGEKIKEFKNQDWEPGEMYQTIVQMNCREMNSTDFVMELEKFKLYYTKEAEWPKNPDKAWLTWCQRAHPEYHSRKLKQERTEEAHKLASERISQFDQKKRENISKINSTIQNQNPKKPVLIGIESLQNTQEKFKNAKIVL